MKSTRIWTLLLLFGLALALPPAAAAANITIVNLDAGTGQGLDDPTPAAPIGTNPGTTLGEQRLNAFNRAANIWGLLLNSSVTVRVQATFTPLPCNAGSATLGAAGAISISANFPNATLPNTWYHAALANAQAGSDQDPANDDIVAFFNSSIDNNPACLAGIDWYYGLDGSPPGSDIDFLTVILHELAHGLGFSSFIDSAGNPPGPPFLDDVWNYFLYDATLMLLWKDMTPAQRVFSSTNTGNLVWSGASVTAASGILTAGINAATGFVQMYAPPAFSGGSSVSHWDTALFPNELMEPFLSLTTDDPSLAVPLMADIAWSTNPQVYWLYKPIPGQAGKNNLFSTTNGTAGATTYILFGTAAGARPVPGCPGVFVGINAPQVLTSGANDALGNFDFTAFVGGGAAGQTFIFQAVELTTCTVSNRFRATF